jgi:hypothetical protein
MTEPPMLPEELHLNAYGGGMPLSGAWFVLTLQMSTKNSYRLLFGPASPEGMLTISREDIRRQVTKVRDLFLMDYVDPDIGWTGVLEVAALNRSAIANVLLAHDTYRAAGVYPNDISETLTELEVVLSNLETKKLTVTATLRGGAAVKVLAPERPVD